MSKRGEITLIGKQVPVPETPEQAKLECFANPGVDFVQFSTIEFTSLCPLTGQPDWGEIEVEYTPNEWCLESKSLKLYLQSFRSFEGFAESIVAKIANDLFKFLQPEALRVFGKFRPRGGVAITAATILFKKSESDDDAE